MIQSTKASIHCFTEGTYDSIYHTLCAGTL